MVTHKRISIPIVESSQSQPITGLASVLAWQADHPTMRFKELVKVGSFSRSKAYELRKSDPTFPKGTPLYDSENSPKFYWTHEVMAWLEARSNKFNNQLKDIKS